MAKAINSVLGDVSNIKRFNFIVEQAIKPTSEQIQDLKVDHLDGVSMQDIDAIEDEALKDWKIDSQEFSILQKVLKDPQINMSESCYLRLHHLSEKKEKIERFDFTRTYKEWWLDQNASLLATFPESWLPEIERCFDVAIMPIKVQRIIDSPNFRMLTLLDVKKLVDLIEFLPLNEDYSLISLLEQNEASCENLLLKTDSQGMTLLDRLHQCIHIKLHREFTQRSMPREIILSLLIDEIANPIKINQGIKRTCAAASMQYLLVKNEPAEYVRIVQGLMTPTGEVRLVNGELLSRARCSIIDGKLLNLSPTECLFQAAMMDFCNPGQDYNFYFDKFRDGNSGLSDTQIGKGISALFGGTITYITEKNDFIQYLRKRKTAIINVGLYWLENKKSKHALSFKGMKDNRIYLRNTNVQSGVAFGTLLSDPPRRIESETATFSMSITDFKNWCTCIMAKKDILEIFEDARSGKFGQYPNKAKIWADNKLGLSKGEVRHLIELIRKDNKISIEETEVLNLTSDPTYCKMDEKLRADLNFWNPTCYPFSDKKLLELRMEYTQFCQKDDRPFKYQLLRALILATKIINDNQSSDAAKCEAFALRAYTYQKAVAMMKVKGHLKFDGTIPTPNGLSFIVLKPSHIEKLALQDIATYQELRRGDPHQEFPPMPLVYSNQLNLFNNSAS